MGLENLNKKLQKIIDNNISDDVLNYIRSDLKQKFLEANKKQIFKNSEDIYGYPLGFYSKSTEKYYDSNKKAGTPFTMINTGDLEKGMYIRVSNKFRKIYIGSHSNHGKLFEKEQGVKIFGLQKHRFDYILKKWIKPYIKKKLSLD